MTTQATVCIAIGALVLGYVIGLLDAYHIVRKAIRDGVANALR